jgi:hypothetical protein
MEITVIPISPLKVKEITRRSDILRLNTIPAHPIASTLHLTQGSHVLTATAALNYLSNGPAGSSDYQAGYTYSYHYFYESEAFLICFCQLHRFVL